MARCIASILPDWNISRSCCPASFLSSFEVNMRGTQGVYFCIQIIITVKYVNCFFPFFWGFFLSVSGLQISLIKGDLSIIMGEHIDQARRRKMDMELMEAIKGRRSIRMYKSDPVPEEALKMVMEAVRWSPSWANTQCWKVIVVKDSKMKSDVAEALPKSNPALSSIMEAPLLLILCGKKGISGFYKDQPRTEKGDWLMFDIGLAMQNLCLTAHALGLGTVIVGMFEHKKVGKILDVPQDIEVVAMTPLGYPVAVGSIPKRKEVSEFVFYDKYSGK